MIKTLEGMLDINYHVDTDLGLLVGAKGESVLNYIEEEYANAISIVVTEQAFEETLLFYIKLAFELSDKSIVVVYGLNAHERYTAFKQYGYDVSKRAIFLRKKTHLTLTGDMYLHTSLLDYHIEENHDAKCNVSPIGIRVCNGKPVLIDNWKGLPPKHSMIKMNGVDCSSNTIRYFNGYSIDIQAEDPVRETIVLNYRGYNLKLNLVSKVENVEESKEPLLYFNEKPIHRWRIYSSIGGR